MSFYYNLEAMDHKTEELQIVNLEEVAEVFFQVLKHQILHKLIMELEMEKVMVMQIMIWEDMVMEEEVLLQYSNNYKKNNLNFFLDNWEWELT